MVGGDSDLRNTEEGVILRRIVTVQYLEPGKILPPFQVCFEPNG